MVQRPRFPTIKTGKIVSGLRDIQVAGKVIRPSTAACIFCRRRIYPMGRLPFPGLPTCTEDACAVIPWGKATKLFRTPYGTSLGRTEIRILCRVLRLPSGRVLIQKKPLVDRAEALAEAHARLIAWQQAYDHWEYGTNPRGYRLGQIRIPPPRTLLDVSIFRTSAPLLPRDPTEDLPEETTQVLKRVLEEGPKAISAPF